MAHCNTILNQILKIVPRHEFESLGIRHHTGRKFRTTNRWSQFTAIVLAQLTGRMSLRDIVQNMKTQAHRLYHLGVGKLSKSNFSRINENKSYKMYEELFGKLLARTQAMPQGHGFRFKNKLYSLDASTIDLCLNLFPWARFRKNKGAVKLHVGLNHTGYLPEFIAITDGKTADVTAGRCIDFPKHSIVVCDRGYNDYDWFNSLTMKEVFFVTRIKTNAKYEVIKSNQVNSKQSVISDEVIRFTGLKASEKCPAKLRLVTYYDSKTDKQYQFLTNHFKLIAKTIADIYKSRWQIELFFKWIKQNLKIKKFIGTSENAVMTQIWVAMCVYLIISFIKHASKIPKSMQQILRLLQLNLFEKRELLPMLLGVPMKIPIDPNQKLLFGNS
jgi:putative transposase